MRFNRLRDRVPQNKPTSSGIYKISTTQVIDHMWDKWVVNNSKTP
jgi:hypothetical protein